MLVIEYFYLVNIFRTPGKKKSFQIQISLRCDCLRFVLFYIMKTNNRENEKEEGEMQDKVLYKRRYQGQERPNYTQV